MTKEEYVQLHEQILNDQSQKIVELESHANYKDIIIMELKENMKEIKDAVTKLNDNFNNFTLKSVKDDNLLKDIINQQNNRITALETKSEQQEKTFKNGLVIISLVFAGITVFFNFIH